MKSSSFTGLTVDGGYQLRTWQGLPTWAITHGLYTRLGLLQSIVSASQGQISQGREGARERGKEKERERERLRLLMEAILPLRLSLQNPTASLLPHWLRQLWVPPRLQGGNRHHLLMNHVNVWGCGMRYILVKPFLEQNDLPHSL